MRIIHQGRFQYGAKQKCWHMTPLSGAGRFCQVTRAGAGVGGCGGERGEPVVPKTRKGAERAGEESGHPLSFLASDICDPFMWDLVKPGELQRAKTTQCVGGGPGPAWLETCDFLCTKASEPQPSGDLVSSENQDNEGDGRPSP